MMIVFIHKPEFLSLYFRVKIAQEGSVSKERKWIHKYKVKRGVCTVQYSKSYINKYQITVEES